MKLPRHKMGMHWIPAHNRREDHDYAKRLAPSVIKIIDPDPNFAHDCLSYIDPNGFVWLRDHPLSEQKNDQMKDPIGTGIRHANEWADKLFRGRFKDIFDPKRFIVSGINEPFVRDAAEEKAAFEYNKAMLDRATVLGFKVAALNLSVGWPRNMGTGLPPVWDPFLALEDSINKGGHFLCVHEYWYNDPDESWTEVNGIPFGWLAHRVNYCPMQVPIIIGECGMEKMVDANRWNNEGRPNKGWMGNVSADVFAKQLWKYADKVNPNVFSVLPFTTDWGSHDWDTQDTLGAHNQILARAHSANWPSTYPTKPTLHEDEGQVVIDPTPTQSTKMAVHRPYPPNTGTFVRGFGSTPTHGGIDISMVSNTPLYAMADGVVAWADTDDAANGGYGNYVRVFYPSLGFDSFYAHLTRYTVKTGDTVKKGQIVGYSGSTGNSTGPHLHLEIRLKNMSVANPIHAYSPNSAFGNGRTDPEGVLRMLQLFTDYS
jgi:hypothetical protein